MLTYGTDKAPPIQHRHPHIQAHQPQLQMLKEVQSFRAVRGPFNGVPCTRQDVRHHVEDRGIVIDPYDRGFLYHVLP